MALRPSRVLIQNFRSIKRLELNLDPPCLVLLGVNESGKTNILRALATLSSATKLVDDDVRQLPSDEAADGEASVEFFFSLAAADWRAISETLAGLILGRQGAPFSPDDEKLFSLGDEQLSIAELVEQRVKEILYYVDLREKRRYGRLWRLPTALAVAEGWLVPTKACPAKHSFAHPSAGEVLPHEYWLLNESEIPEGQPPGYFRRATVEDIQARLSAVCRSHLEARLPECIWWSFKNDEALPASVAFEAFLADPSSSLALENMFRIGGLDQPKAAIAEARKRSNGVRTLLERVGARSTQYVRSVWSEFSALSLELHENGALLECVIRDAHGAYNFQRRSDGFRRFVGFLLQVAARAKSGALQGAVLLYDEPDTSLHPSGATQLRDELLRLAEQNLVIYSTHSIFMVDPDCLARHLVIRRQSETTIVRRATPSTVADEEVLYNAVGYSLFSVLRDRNVMVEGHKDRLLLRCAIESDANTLAAYSDIGICHAGGVRNVSKITPMLELAGRECLVVSDGDRAATDSRKEYSGHADWITYTELVGQSFVTAEDFLTPLHIRDVLVRLAAGDVPELSSLVGPTAPRGGGLMKKVSEALAVQNVEKARRGEVASALKDALFKHLTSKELLPEALDLAKAILERARSMNGRLPNSALQQTAEDGRC